MKCTVAITLFLLLAQSISAKECPRSDAIAAERLTDSMTSWRNIYTAYRQYGHCYDGPIAEGVTDKVVHLLATNWETLGQAQQFIAEDPSFQTFVIRNIDITAATPELDRVVYLATHRCPKSATHMLPSAVTLLSAALLLISACSALASDNQYPPRSPAPASQPAGAHNADSSAVSYRLEVPLWPEGSQVLLDGINALAHEKWALTHPTYLVYSPTINSSRSAILVFPGGGYKALAIGPNSTLGPQGADVCKWLTDSGITCILVKYRVPNTGCNWNSETRRHEQPEIPMALQDAQRAISLVRYNAGAYAIDPDKIGVMGFSAGGNLAVLASTAFRHRTYEPIDAVDQMSIRPDFAIPVYPGHLTMEHKNKTPKSVAAGELNTDIHISSDVPPTLLIHAEDDAVDPAYYSRVYEEALRKAGVNVELKLYATGGHAFGVKRQGTDTDRWTDDALRWLDRLEMP